LTELLGRWSRGDSAAGDALVPLVYDELRRIARRCLVGKGKGHTLQPTAQSLPLRQIFYAFIPNNLQRNSELKGSAYGFRGISSEPR
jgi:hypothetical protein